MEITLNHTIVPSRDKVASAKYFARIFGFEYNGTSGHFAPVKVNKTLTLDFDNREEFESHHYAFHVSEDDFDGILGRLREEKIPYGSGPGSQEDMEINHWNGGSGLYFKDPDGHLFELLTRP